MRKSRIPKTTQHTAETIVQLLCEKIQVSLCENSKEKKNDLAINWQEKLFLTLPRVASVVVVVHALN